MWSAFVLTLPKQPNAVRLRVRRALKVSGCGSSNDGAHVLPKLQSALFHTVLAAARGHGGHGSVFARRTGDAARHAEVLAASFGFEADPRLQRTTRAVHFLDMGGVLVPEAAALFDAFYAVPGAAR